MTDHIAFRCDPYCGSGAYPIDDGQHDWGCAPQCGGEDWRAPSEQDQQRAMMDIRQAAHTHDPKQREQLLQQAYKLLHGGDGPQCGQPPQHAHEPHCGQPPEHHHKPHCGQPPEPWNDPIGVEPIRAQPIRYEPAAGATGGGGSAGGVSAETNQLVQKIEAQLARGPQTLYSLTMRDQLSHLMSNHNTQSA
jgi:hypothetical protein